MGSTNTTITHARDLVARFTLQARGIWKKRVVIHWMTQHIIYRLGARVPADVSNFNHGDQLAGKDLSCFSVS